MANLEGNDIDDLFKRASDKYPLRTDSSDWDKLAAALEKDPSLIVPPPSTEGDRRRRRGFFWLFLLLPLIGIGYYVWQTAGSTAAAPKSVGTVRPVQPGTRPDQQLQTSAKTDADRQAPAAITSTPAANTGTAVAKPTERGGAAATNGTEAEARHQTGSVRQVAALSGKYGSSAPAGPHKTKLSGKALRNSGSDFSDEAIASVTRPDGGNRGYDPALSNLNWQRARISNGVALNVTVKAANTTTTAKDSSSAKAVSKKNKSKKESSFYAGLLVAPDLSTVKFQSVKGVGTNYGILLGYNINRKWAIETGAYLDHKKYYTSGEYFKKSGSASNYDLKSVTGSCNMVEIPVNIRYNLSSGLKTKWFATAGFSTYLMSSESYVSKIDTNGWVWDSPWRVNKPSQYWFSVFNFSVGYEQRLGKIGNLRLEPYLRIPLAGLGSGSLPIMSAGLNIGITRKLW